MAAAEHTQVHNHIEIGFISRAERGALYITIRTSHRVTNLEQFYDKNMIFKMAINVVESGFTGLESYGTP